MTLRNLRPILRTWDLPATISFYEQVLGFVCREHLEDFGWALVEKDGISIMFSGPNEHEGDKRPAFTGSLYFSCDDVDQVWQTVSQKARVCYEPENFEYGMREFGIYDNNGYLIQFGTPLDQDR